MKKRQRLGVCIFWTVLGCFLFTQPAHSAVKVSPMQPVKKVTIKSPLGENAVSFMGLDGKEEISRMFSYNLSMLSLSLDINPDDILGEVMTLEIDFHNGSHRFINGMVNNFAYTGTDDKGISSYQARIVPQLWLLTLQQNCRIFQEMNTPSIVTQILNEHGITDFQMDLAKDYPTRECAVQYKESDFNFISRLMEEEGIYYYFQHGDGTHTLKVTDFQGSVPSIGSIPFIQVSSNNPSTSSEGITAWKMTNRLISGKFAHTDYNFETPSLNLLTQSSIIEGHDHADLEVFDYPGKYETLSRGSDLAQVRIQALHSEYAVASASSTSTQIASGSSFDLTNALADKFNGKYLIISAEHKISEDGYMSKFICVPDSTTFRPSRITPKPIVSGVQTARVVGPSGEEIHADEHGRVKVQFHWDREGQSDENSSCWIRVAQNWNEIFSTPRIGWEVVVDFLEGDPDRPLVTGRVYNSEDIPPFPDGQ